MLTNLPAYAVYSAMYFQDYTPETVVHEKPSLWSFKRKDFVKEDEDWVFL